MESVIVATPATLIISVIAMFAVIISWFLKNKILSSVLTVGSFLGVLFCIIYSLLLGASLTEVLILILIFVALNAFAFLPKAEKKEEKKEERPENDGTVKEEENSDEL